MSPQPMNHRFADFSLNYSNEILDERPNLAALIAKVIAGWSVVEFYNGLVFASLVGERADTTMILYESLTSAGAKDGALLALASNRLSKEDLRIYRATMSHIGKISKCRNAFAHGVIASRDDLKDGIILLESKMAALAYYAKLVCEVNGQPASQAYSNIVPRLMNKSKIYREPNLTNLVARIEVAQTIMSHLILFCRSEAGRDEARAKLLDQRDVTRELQKIIKRESADGSRTAEDPS